MLDVDRPHDRPVRAGIAMVVLLLGAALGVAACYTPVNATTPAPSGATTALATLPPFAIATTVPVPTDPCSFLTTDQLYRATSDTFPAGQVQTAGTTVECDWSVGSDSVILSFSPLDPAAFSAKMASQITSPNLDYPAYLDASNTLHAAKDGLDVGILAIVRSDPASGYQAALGLMPQVLAKV
jgi:hypothetical protein